MTELPGGHQLLRVDLVSTTVVVGQARAQVLYSCTVARKSNGGYGADPATRDFKKKWTSSQTKFVNPANAGVNTCVISALKIINSTFCFAHIPFAEGYELNIA